MKELGLIIPPHAIRFERHLPGPIGRVWDHLTLPSALAGWLAAAAIDLRAGGRVELRFDAEEVPERRIAGAAIRGVIHRCEPPRALAYSWIDAPPGGSPPAGPAPDSTVSVDLEPRGAGVLLVLIHGGLPPDLLGRCGAGWHAHLWRLRALPRIEEPEPFARLFRRLLPEYEDGIGAPWRSAPPS
jgi:uncharacterized protein YndB with AHSA1/START domain